MLVEVTPFDQRAEVLLQGIATCASQPDDVSHRDSAVLSGELDDLQRKFRQRREHQLLALDLLVRRRTCSASDREKKIPKPGLPVRRFGADRPLRLPQGEVVGILVCSITL